MWNLRLLPYKMGSESAKDLADLLECLRVKPDGDYVPKHLHTICNWGYSGAPVWSDRARARGVKILNKPSAVNVAAHKLNAFQALQAAGVSIPKFTTDINTAKVWLRTGYTVVERHELRGNSGAGIRIVNLDDPDMDKEINHAPLYTQFINKTAEFRVHIFNGEVIDYIEKRRVSSERRDESFNKYISSVECGWTFCRTNIREISEVKELAIKAVKVLGLDFGAVDIVYFDNRAYVLEVNAAPGLAGTTLVKYGNALRKIMGQPDLPSHVTQSLLDSVTTHRVSPPVVAARVAEVDNTMHEIVSLRMTKATAKELRGILLSLNL